MKIPGTTKAPGTSGMPSKGGPVQADVWVAFPRLPSSSAVDLTLSEETKSSYAEMLATARQNVPLAEVGTKRVTIK